MDFFLQNADLVIFLVLLILGYAAGTWSERNHYRSIRSREEDLLQLPAVTGDETFVDGEILHANLVHGSVVVSIDYFKRLLAILRNIFGGRVVSYESLVDRARREAILRMKEEASAKGATIVVNLRLETSAIGFRANSKGQVGSVEALAYGTALTVQR